MKIKIVILATVCSLLSSCGSDLPTTRNIKPYIVKSIDGHNDKLCKYNNYYCQSCIRTQSGMISPCNTCSNNSQYKICIFKVKKDHFVSSTLGIASDKQNAWEIFKSNII